LGDGEFQKTPEIIIAPVANAALNFFHDTNLRHAMTPFLAYINPFYFNSDDNGKEKTHGFFLKDSGQQIQPAVLKADQ